MEEAGLQVVETTCSLGAVLVAGNAEGVRAVLLGDDSAAVYRELRARWPGTPVREAGPAFLALAGAVAAHLDEPAGDLGVPLDVRGTPFQREVWEALRAIPPGSTASYAELAARIGRPHSERAVGQACAANPLAVIIPCHRAVRGDGSLSGYRWGLARKRRLLERESRAGRRPPPAGTAP